MNIGRVSGSSTPTAITDVTTITAASAYPTPARQCSRPRPSSAQPKPSQRNRITRPIAAAGTVATPAHGVVKCATRLVSANTTTTTATSTYTRKRCNADSCTASGCGSVITSLGYPGPLRDLRVVLAVLPGVAARGQPGVGHPLSQHGGAVSQPVDPVDHVHHQMEA